MDEQTRILENKYNEWLSKKCLDCIRRNSMICNVCRDKGVIQGKLDLIKEIEGNIPCDGCDFDSCSCSLYDIIVDMKKKLEDELNEPTGNLW